MSSYTPGGSGASIFSYASCHPAGETPGEIPSTRSTSASASGPGANSAGLALRSPVRSMSKGRSYAAPSFR
jgi:hypothetical protein